MKLYSAQREIVLNTIEETGNYFVKGKFIKQKYGEVAGVMFNAYDWFVKEMIRVVDKPLEAEYPVWHSVDAKYLHMDHETKLITLSIPDEKVILFDNHGWERVLQMNYVGESIEDEMTFDRGLKAKGIDDGYKVFTTPYYPLEKQEIIKSWKRIFDVSESRAVRAASWNIKKSWVE